MSKENDYRDDASPPNCAICKKQLDSKWDDVPDTELYVIAGTYFDGVWDISCDLEPRYYICIKCFNEKIKPILEAKECDGTKQNPNCNNQAVWKVVGYASRFGVPLTQYACDECKEYIERHPFPKIMAYNRFKTKFTKLKVI